ncbi:MAG: CBS domain-containing protein [Clostridia bacterium]|nr:CBS domain-containing protein [Clostridia bacterium]
MKKPTDIFQFLTVKKNTYYVNADSTIRQALEKFDYHKFSVVSILDKNGVFVSTVSEGDILRYIKNHARFDITAAENVLVKDIEKYRPYKPVTLSASMDEVLSVIMDQNFVPVTDDRGVYSGIIKRKTLIEYLYKNAIRFEE